MDYAVWNERVRNLEVLRTRLLLIAKKLEFSIEKCRLSDGKITLPELEIEENSLASIARACEDVLNKVVESKKNDKMAAHEYMEFSSVEEYKKFQGLPPISLDELDCTDLDQMYEHFGIIS